MGAIFGTSKVSKGEIKANNILVEDVNSPQMPASVRGLLSPSSARNKVAHFDPSST